MNQRQLSVQTIVCTADDILMLDAGRGNSSIYVSNMVLQVTDCIADHLLPNSWFLFVVCLSIAI